MSVVLVAVLAAGVVGLKKEEVDNSCMLFSVVDLL